MPCSCCGAPKGSFSSRRCRRRKLKIEHLDAGGQLDRELWVAVEMTDPPPVVTDERHDPPSTAWTPSAASTSGPRVAM
jgi:hypothetical protein